MIFQQISKFPLAFPAFALKFLYISNQLSGRLKTSATEQKNDINN